MTLPLLNILVRVMNYDASTAKHKTHLGINILALLTPRLSSSLLHFCPTSEPCSTKNASPVPLSTNIRWLTS